MGKRIVRTVNIAVWINVEQKVPRIQIPDDMDCINWTLQASLEVGTLPSLGDCRQMFLWGKTKGQFCFEVHAMNKSNMQVLHPDGIVLWWSP